MYPKYIMRSPKIQLKVHVAPVWVCPTSCLCASMRNSHLAWHVFYPTDHTILVIGWWPMTCHSHHGLQWLERSDHLSWCTDRFPSHPKYANPLLWLTQTSEYLYSIDQFLWSGEWNMKLQGNMYDIIEQGLWMAIMQLQCEEWILSLRLGPSEHSCVLLLDHIRTSTYNFSNFSHCIIWFMGHGNH